MTAALGDTGPDSSFGHRRVEDSQFPEEPGDVSALAGARNMLLKRYSSHTLSLSRKQPLLAVESFDLDTHGMEGPQRPDIPVLDPDLEPTTPRSIQHGPSDHHRRAGHHRSGDQYISVP